MTIAPRSIVQDIGLFLVLLLFADIVFAAFGGQLSPVLLIQTFYLMAIVHIGASLYDSAFDRFRTITWLLLIPSWAAAEWMTFVGFILPFGQIKFWIAANMPWAATVLDAVTAAPATTPILMLVVFCLDLLVMQRSRWHGRLLWLVALIITALVFRYALAQIIATFLPPEEPSVTSELATSEPEFAIMPPWYALPFYSMLRAIPDKTMGVVVAFAALLAPTLWPFIHAGPLRSGTMRWFQRVAWLGFIATFLGLTYLGAQMPEQNMLRYSQVLIGYYFVYLLVIPLLLRRFGMSQAADS